MRGSWKSSDLVHLRKKLILPRTSFFSISFAQDFNETKEKAEQGDLYAQYNLALMCDNGDVIKQDVKQALYCKKAASQEHASAQYRLCLMYLAGYGTSKNRNQGAYWIKKSYDNGNETAKKVWEGLRLGR